MGYIALLRAVNVGGTGLLAMRDLVAICERAGFDRPQTYIASGNVVFASDLPEEAACAALAAGLREHTGRTIGVFVRSATEIGDIVANNPFPKVAAAKVAALFVRAPPSAAALDEITGRSNEEVRIGRRVLYVHYPDGMGRSRLKIPVALEGTGRNMNTLAKLAALASGL